MKSTKQIGPTNERSVDNNIQIACFQKSLPIKMNNALAKLYLLLEYKSSWIASNVKEICWAESFDDKPERSSRVSVLLLASLNYLINFKLYFVLFFFKKNAKKKCKKKM